MSSLGESIKGCIYNDCSYNDRMGASTTVMQPRGCTNLKLRQLSREVTRHYDAYVRAPG